jgi:hypothetical protein
MLMIYLNFFRLKLVGELAPVGVEGDRKQLENKIGGSTPHGDRLPWTSDTINATDPRVARNDPALLLILQISTYAIRLFGDCSYAAYA